MHEHRFDVWCPLRVWCQWCFNTLTSCISIFVSYLDIAPVICWLIVAANDAKDLVSGSCICCIWCCDTSRSFLHLALTSEWIDVCNFSRRRSCLISLLHFFDDPTLIIGRLSLLCGHRWLSSHTSLLRLRYGLSCLPSDLQTLMASEPRYSVATWRLLWVFTASACAMLCCGFYFCSTCFLSNERWTDRIIDALCISYLAPFCAKLCLTATFIAC